MPADSHEILTRVHGGVGFITLNRPSAINSLTHSMVIAMHQTLSDWAGDDEVRAVVVDGAGERGLCAGGDVVAIYHVDEEGLIASLRAFWEFDQLRMLPPE